MKRIELELKLLGFEVDKLTTSLFGVWHNDHSIITTNISKEKDFYHIRTCNICDDMVKVQNRKYKKVGTVCNRIFDAKRNRLQTKDICSAKTDSNGVPPKQTA